MKYLDISGVKASAIVAGCMRIGSMEPEALSRFVHAALDNGVNFFDHADIYGGGECEAAGSGAWPAGQDGSPEQVRHPQKYV